MSRKLLLGALVLGLLAGCDERSVTLRCTNGEWKRSVYVNRDTIIKTSVCVRQP